MVSMVVRLGATGGMGCRVLALLLPKARRLLVAPAEKATPRHIYTFAFAPLKASEEDDRGLINRRAARELVDGI
jgi:hypothetical protein